MSDSAGTPPFALRYSWTTRELDRETGFFFLRARYYHSLFRRFVQEDPSGFSGDVNLYAYAEGNPTNGRDPNGLDKYYEYSAFTGHDRSYGRQILDWDQDGLDDIDEFADYSWARQLWMAASGEEANFDAVWYGTLRISDPFLRDVVLTEFYFGNVEPVKRAELGAEEADGLNLWDSLAETNGGPGSPFFQDTRRPYTIYVSITNPLPQVLPDWTAIMAHEASHLTLSRRGIYGTPGQCGSNEQMASDFAFARTGVRWGGRPQSCS